jgi:transcriptional regulator of acetoin/glycerol metabolism
MNIRDLMTVAQQLMLRHRERPRLHATDLPPELLWGVEGAASATASARASATASARASAVPERVDADLLRDALSTAPRNSVSSDLRVALLSELGGNITEVARRLGRDRAQVYRWFKRWGIALDDYRRPDGGAELEDG